MQQLKQKNKSYGVQSAPRELDNRVRVITPENIEFDYRVAGPFIRGLAYLLDLIILLVGLLILQTIYFFLLGLFVAWLFSNGMTGTAETFGAMGFAVFMVFAMFVIWSYGSICEARFHGRTLGKMATNLRVITREGHKITYGQAYIRNLVRLGELLPFIPLATLIGWIPMFADMPVSPFGPPSCLVALIAMTLNSKNQRIGDILAGTMVIIEEKTHRQKFATFSDPRVAQLAEYVPAGYVVSSELTKALADYGLRRNYMSIERAREIAGHLAKYLLVEFNLPADTCPDLLLCALYYRTFTQKHMGESEVFYPSNVSGGQSKEPFMIS